MNTFKVGFSRVNVTPMLGIGISGYYKPRYADGVLDELELNALALEAKGKKILLLSLDNCGPGTKEYSTFRAEISKATGIPAEAIFIHSTHTHTGPFVVADSEDALEREYFTMLLHRMADAAVLAVADMKPARMGWAVGQAPNIAFVRRFRMKDGSVQTNPGVGNPNIDHPPSAMWMSASMCCVSTVKALTPSFWSILPIIPIPSAAARSPLTGPDF